MGLFKRKAKVFHDKDRANKKAKKGDILVTKNKGREITMERQAKKGKKVFGSWKITENKPAKR